MISNRYGLETGTLAEKVKGNFSSIKLKKAKVRVPEVKLRRKKPARDVAKADKQVSVSTIIRILIKNAVEETKKKAEKNTKEPEGKTYRVLKDDEDPNVGGYGTTSRAYASPVHTPYVDYGKLFSYLGKFKAQTPQNEFTSGISQALESKGFSLIDTESVEKGVRHIKYGMPKTADAYNLLGSLIPIPGMSSGEWEQFKLMMQIDRVMYALKMSTS